MNQHPAVTNAVDVIGFDFDVVDGFRFFPLGHALNNDGSRQGFEGFADFQITRRHPIVAVH